MDTKVDIIVRFQGAGGVLWLPDIAIYPDTLLKVYNSKPNRTLLRIGTTTNTVGSASFFVISQVIRGIKNILRSNTLGSIFIYGSSSGGRNALFLASALNNEGINIDYVALQDAAFFPQETNDKPRDGFIYKNPITGEEITKEPVNTPMFSVQPIMAMVKENYYQTLGNHFGQRETLWGEDGYFGSSMKGKEIHGHVNGFTPKDLSDEVLKTIPGWGSDDSRHVKLINLSNPKVYENIRLRLDSL